MELSNYLALGDSMSIDLYPSLDAGATDVRVALERSEQAGEIAPLGAASLLYRNESERWPDDEGNDLTTFYPGVTFRSLAADRATIGDVFGEQLAAVSPGDEPTLVTLTIGSEDLFSAFFSETTGSLLDRVVADTAAAFDLLVDAIRAGRPESSIILTTVCDPSDRTGKLPAPLAGNGEFPLAALESFNDHIRAIGAITPRTVVADAHEHFLGHGASVPAKERWYWRRAPLEPNVQGANELRRLWRASLETLEARGPNG